MSYYGNGTETTTIAASAVTKFVFEQHPRRQKMAEQHTAENYDQTARDLDAATLRLLASIEKLVDTEKEAAIKAKAALSRAKDNVAQVTDSLNRVNKILGNDFTQRLDQLERVAAAMEQLVALDKAGKLSGVISALRG